VEDVGEAFRRAATDKATIGQTYELCGPHVMTLEEVVRMTAAVAGLRCSIVRLPDFVSFAQAVVMNFLPGKPFSVDNYRSLTIDAVCSEDGCARLGIKPQPMLAVLPTYLGEGPSRLPTGSAQRPRRS